MPSRKSSSKAQRVSRAPSKPWTRKDFMWLVIAIANLFAMITLMVDHAMYPGNPADPDTPPAPEYMTVLRDVAFFILVVSCILLMVYVMMTFKFHENLKLSAFIVANMMFFVASLVYVFVYRYELDFSAQQGSTASNFYYAAVGYLGLVMVTLAIGGCLQNPIGCDGAVRGVGMLLYILAGGR